MDKPTFCCLTCGGHEHAIWLRTCRDFYLGLGTPVDYVTCKDCGLVQQWPLPDHLDALYANYPVHQRRSTLQQFARRVLQRQVYFRPCGDAAALTLLDYGCGDGVYLREMAGRYRAMLGYEPGENHATALAESLGVPIYSDPEILLREWAGQVDVITAHYVMEHVVDLHQTLDLFHRVLKPGGLVHIAVPNVRSWEARLFGRKWHGLDPPRHISFPNLDTFQRLAARHGFAGVKRSYAIFPNTLAASLVTVLTGKYDSVWFHLLILPGWAAAALAPSGTEVFEIRKPT
jgi:SAM-dependent methyltransferase